MTEQTTNAAASLPTVDLTSRSRRYFDYIKKSIDLTASSPPVWPSWSPRSPPGSEQAETAGNVEREQTDRSPI